VNIEIDVQGAEELADDLLDIPEEVRPKVRAVVSKGALNIKKDMRAEAKSGGSYKHFHRSIDYDLIGDLEAEIGPDKSRVQGALGNILYFGTSKNSPVLDINGPLNREEPRFLRALGDVAEDIL
jgi:hypothetical protein